MKFLYRNVYILLLSNDIMVLAKNLVRSKIVDFFRSKRKVLASECVLFAMTLVFFDLELGYWVFSAFLGILGILFYIGVNLNKDYYISDVAQDETVEDSFLDEELYQALEKISESAQISIRNIQDIKKDMNETSEYLEKLKLGF